MLEKWLTREDVSNLLKKICNGVVYGDKKPTSSNSCCMQTVYNQLVFIIYEAIFKYAIIIESDEYFHEFIEQVEKLVKKIDNIDDMSVAIDKIIGKICGLKLGYKEIEDEKIKSVILEYIYQKYIVEGYYIHGFNSHYYKSIFDNGFVIDEYENLYGKFIEIQEILKEKGKEDLLKKDFSCREISFTDSLFSGCYYSANAPMYFSSLLCRNDYVDPVKYGDAYLNNDYDKCLKNLNRLIEGLELNDKQKDLFIDTFNEEWTLLDKSNNNISLMLVPTKVIGLGEFDFDKFKEEVIELDTLSAVNRLLSNRGNVIVNTNIGREDIEFISVFGASKYIIPVKKESFAEDTLNTFISGDDPFAFSNMYGKVSILLLLGTLLITVGTILGMIMFS